LREVGEAPSPGLREHAAGLRSHSPLPPPPAVGSSGPGDGSTESTESVSPVGSSTAHTPHASHPSPTGHSRAPDPPEPSARRSGLRGDEFLLLTTTRFFGREAEMARLSALLRAPRTRLVTLSGAGGTGKTRL